MPQGPEEEHLLTPAEVAARFRVDPKTVTRWAQNGKLTSIRTLGGHRRYRESEVNQLLKGTQAALGLIRGLAGVCTQLWREEQAARLAVSKKS